MSIGTQWQTRPAARLYALDYDLKAISSLLTRVASADGSWAYVVERSGRPWTLKSFRHRLVYLTSGSPFKNKNTPSGI